MNSKKEQDLNNRLRLLEIYNILREYTDEENRLTVEQIASLLQRKYDKFENVDRNTIRKDIKALMDYGYGICKEKGKQNIELYNHVSKMLDIYELRVILDALTSARFLTVNETKRIVEKLQALTSNYIAEELESQIFVDSNSKIDNGAVMNYINTIHSAIINWHKVKFQYGNYDVNKQFNLHHNGELYFVDPYALVWNNSFYYLVGFCNENKEIRHYRIDRMRVVKEVDISFEKQEFDIANHMSKTFNMYPGDFQPIEILFDNKLVNAIIDRFGIKADITKYDEQRFLLRTEAAINEGLLRWLLMWGGDAQVISPASLLEKMKYECNKMNSLY